VKPTASKGSIRKPWGHSAASVERTPLSVYFVGGVGAALLFGVSAWRHHVHRSTAFDLGVYDQIVFLLSRGEAPISSFLGFHFLGDHVALAIYPLALLYRIHPTVLWLFAVQALALAAGVVITWRLARAYGVDVATSKALASAYLLYPAVYNTNLFDFHPDVLAVPGLLWALEAARKGQVAPFVAATVWVLACKAPHSLTVLAMGVWLATFGARRALGAFAAVAGTLWFLFTTRVVIPHFSGGEAIGVGRFAYLGDSVFEVMANVILRPDLVAAQVLTLENATYLGLVAVVFLWWIAPRHLWALLPALPAVAMNVLGTDPQQRTLGYQYALPALPFLVLAVATSFGRQARTLGSTIVNRLGGRSQVPAAVVAWSLLCFAWLGAWGHSAEQLVKPAGWRDVRVALSMVPPDAAVLTDNLLAPQMTHRSLVFLVEESQSRIPPSTEYVLLDLGEPWPDTESTIFTLVRQLDEASDFRRVFESGRVRLYVRSPGPRT